MSAVDLEFVPCLPGKWGRPAERGRTQLAVDASKVRPGEWAVYKRSPQRPQLGQYRANFPGTEWTYRRTATDEYTTFFRWIG